MDLFALTLPLSLEGVRLTPWVMAGMIGANAWDAMDNDLHKASYPGYSLRPYPLATAKLGFKSIIFLKIGKYNGVDLPTKLGI